MAETLTQKQEWNARLNDFANGHVWHFQRKDTAPYDLPMGMTFPFRQLREVFSDSCKSPWQSKQEVMESFDYNRIGNERKVDVGLYRWVERDDMTGPSGWRYDPRAPRGAEPAVLLHPFFAEYFAFLPDQLNDFGTDTDAKLCRLGASFLLAQVLVHELAHCFNVFPRLICVSPIAQIREMYANEDEAWELYGRIGPECGISWERSVFGKQLPGFLKFNLSAARPDRIYQTTEELLLPDFTDLANHGCNYWRFVNFQGTLYQTTANYAEYERTLVPWRWIWKWFQKEHWHPDRTAAEVKAPPERTWKLHYEIPNYGHRRTWEKGIVRIDIKRPE